MRRIAIALTFLMALTAFSQESKPTGSAAPSTAPTPTTTLSEVQTLRLDNLRLRFYLANQQRDQALNNLMAEAERARKENHLPDNVGFDIDTLKFSLPPTPPVPAKPEAKKK